MGARAAGVPDAARFARLRLGRRTTMPCAGAGRIAWSGPSPRARTFHIKPLARGPCEHAEGGFERLVVRRTRVVHRMDTRNDPDAGDVTARGRRITRDADLE